ncbi:hypothetical protein LTR08_008196 [Meristemomyces frigidus]|nr:hypothetical protein LTR08_008196 [Meristemomyces frigidus]
MSGRSTPSNPPTPTANTTPIPRPLSQLRTPRHSHSHVAPPSRTRTPTPAPLLASLRATALLTTTAGKPALPAELLVHILDYLPPQGLLRFARVSRRLQEMVFDDTRWVQKLRAMGVWDEGEARRRVGEGARRRGEGGRERGEGGERGEGEAGGGGGMGGSSGGTGRRHAGSVTIFDAGVEEKRYRQSLDQSTQAQTQARARKATLADGFDEPTPSPVSPTPNPAKPHDPPPALTVLQSVRSIRGHARHEFSKVHAALNPLYTDLARSRDHSEALLFRTYHSPEQQAQILASLKRFAACDVAQHRQRREAKLDRTIAVFETAVLREFEQGYAANDVEGRMHRYAHVLATLNGGQTCRQTFISAHPLLQRSPLATTTARAHNPLACLDAVAPGHVDLAPAQTLFAHLAATMQEQGTTIAKVFPPTLDVLTPLLSRLCDEVIQPYLSALFAAALAHGPETYVKAVSGTFAQTERFLSTLASTTTSPPPPTSPPTAAFPTAAREMLTTRCYTPHIPAYLTAELALFRSKSEAEVAHWERQLSEQDASTESFFMSNISRQAAKRDFLSSFKKVVMMPVNVLPAFPLSSPFGTKPAPAPAITALATAAEAAPSRPRTPTLTGAATAEAPTTELAAKAAILKHRLEGIKSLFSIEVALNLTHFAKASLERAAVVVGVGGAQGMQAKALCGKIFVALLEILGDRHVRDGFDKAVRHLGSYDPRQVRETRARLEGGAAAAGGGGSEGAGAGVEPLVTFLELVNVGDLIQQMLDVFYAQELVATRLTDRDDFLDPAVKGKKHFEQMLDERVAAGLNKGIDVLMEEVEYICASTQLAADFNPVVSGTTASVADIGPSRTARQVVDTVRSHTSMLVGSTDKTMLDVFTQEVGLRLFAVLCKHLKRQRISVDGAITLIADVNCYAAFITTLRQKPLAPYFQALRELGQIYLVRIDPPGAYFGGNAGGKSAGGGGGGKRLSGFLAVARKGGASSTAAQARELAAIIADSGRYCGIFPAEEVYEFAERRADWYLVRGDVERAMYGVGCAVM